ncbi:ATP synthase subunit I [Paenalkalicoccus suaedae]|uniref:ATP synthase subunit I n=1 Tax=Paenalkalicoccus suaedae TaxID=2592382 RepID=A0A859FIV5_9BACI|nr:ATP synthase subunit I [Paenalkalicoccus suaedae]QKS72754.1 ATP synthase subunit I [Paenalkalicoccus suaedae]
MMNDYKRIAKRYVTYTLIIIAVLVVIAVMTSMSRFFFGVALGASFSLLNLITTYFQVKRISQMQADRKYRFSIGTVGRLMIVVVALVLAQQFPNVFDLTGVIVGLAVTYVILLIDPILQIKHLR